MLLMRFIIKATEIAGRMMIFLIFSYFISVIADRMQTERHINIRQISIGLIQFLRIYKVNQVILKF